MSGPSSGGSGFCGKWKGWGCWDIYLLCPGKGVRTVEQEIDEMQSRVLLTTEEGKPLVMRKSNILEVSLWKDSSLEWTQELEEWNEVLKDSRVAV